MTGPAPSGPVPKPGKYLKVSLFLKKLPTVTDEYFHAYWANNHIKVALETKIFSDRVRRYNQHHITPDFRADAETLGIPVVEYDGVAEVWFDSLEDWKAITSETDFVTAVAGDEAHFILHPIHVMLGYDYLVIGEDWQGVGSSS